jgi:hypothetical protein
LSRSVCGLLLSCAVLFGIACRPGRPGGKVDPKSDTCTNVTSFSLNAESEVPYSYCTIADCPVAPEDQGDIVSRFCAARGQDTCEPCHCPEIEGGVVTSPQPKCKATVGPNPKGSKYVTKCTFERGNTENPVNGCTKEAPGRCTCTITVPKEDTLRCGCACEG